MKLHEIIGDYGVVSKVDVADIDASVRWYETKLGLVHDPRFDVPGWWARLNIPTVPRTAVGLNRDPRGATEGGGGGGAGGGEGAGGAGGAGGGSGRGQVTTFVVMDIEAARDGLIRNGVPAGPIQTVPHGVKLAFFKDPDGNDYGLRQNAENHPAASEIGAA